jgi:hypothetical protein
MPGRIELPFPKWAKMWEGNLEGNQEFGFVLVKSETLRSKPVF